MIRPSILLDFRDWAVVRITGPDALEFLQGTGTQDVAAAAKNAAIPSLFLSEKGRPVALAWLVLEREGKGATIFAEPGSRDTLVPHLNALRVMEEVEIEGPLEAPRLFGVAGSDRESVAREWGEQYAGSEVIAADRVTFLVVPTNAERAVGAADVIASAVSPDQAEAWRIAAGIPRGGVDFDKDRIATELSLPEAISLTKGCYVGQEVVARTTHRGAVRRRRIGFRYPGQAGVLPRGTELKSGGNASGFITSSTLEPGTGRGLGMGYLATEAPQGPGEVVAIHDSKTTPIEVTPWPL
jgi:folate-binding protein YgfZ